MSYKRICRKIKLLALCLVLLTGCSLITAPVDVATSVAKTGVKAITYPVRKAVE